MSDKQALLDCTFGWGKTCRLYHDSIEIAGKSYNLAELTSIHPTYRTLFGITLARLELRFGLRRLMLRGISDLEAARQMVAYLLPYVEQADSQDKAPWICSRTGQDRNFARTQAHMWERTRKNSAPLTAQPHNLVAAQTEALALDAEQNAATIPSLAQTEAPDIFDDFLDLAEPPTPIQLTQQAQEDVSLQLTLPILASALALFEQPTADGIQDQCDVSDQCTLHDAKDQPALSEQPAACLMQDQLALSEQPTVPMLLEAISAAQAVTPASEKKPSCVARPLPAVTLPDMYMPRREPPLRSVQLVNTFPSSESVGPYTSHSEYIPYASFPLALESTYAAQVQRTVGSAMLRAASAPPCRSSVLPIIHVPVRLQPGECAHYSIGATLCSDRLTHTKPPTYVPLDQGLLILTNRRVSYLGKRCQLVLAYTNLWYASVLPHAIALHIEGQFHRIILEVEHPQEWASRIEQLAFIARRSPSRSTPSTPTVVLPGVKPTLTLPFAFQRTANAVPQASQNASGVATNEPAPQHLAAPEQKMEEATALALIALSELDTVKMVALPAETQTKQESMDTRFFVLYDPDTSEKEGE